MGRLDRKLSMAQLEENLRAAMIPGGALLRRVEEALAGAEHLLSIDGAVAGLALDQARVIDRALESGDEEQIAYAARVSMPALLRTLTALGLTPDGRKKLDLDSGEEEEDW